MNICIPVNEDLGLKSAVCAHFGSAPVFMIIDTDTGACRAIANGNRQHEHGQCRPFEAIEGEKLDSVIVGGIGMGAINKLAAARIKIYRAAHATVGETLDAFKAGTLQPVDPASACAHHGHGAH